MTPPVSVVMTVYNRQDFLTEAVESILHQTFKDFEFIIIDDCSTDNSYSMALAFAERDRRIRVHRHEKNLGIVGARNTGLQQAKGKYIAWMDSDDVSLPNRLEKQYTFMKEHPEVGIVSSNAILIDENSKMLSEIKMPQTHLMILWAFCFFDPIINPAVMANRELCQQAGGYRELAKDRSEYYPEDFDLCVRLSKQTHFYIFQDNLLCLRKHGNNVTKTRLESTLRNSATICMQYLQSFLGIEIPRQPLDMIWGVDQPADLTGYPQLMRKLYEHFRSLPEISDTEKEYIQKDASLRMIRMSKNHILARGSLQTIIEAWRINPHLFADVFNAIVNK